jgi:hypothetical protein
MHQCVAPCCRLDTSDPHAWPGSPSAEQLLPHPTPPRTPHHRPLPQSTALVYSMEFLEANLEWLQEALVPYHGSWMMEQVLVFVSVTGSQGHRRLSVLVTPAPLSRGPGMTVSECILCTVPYTLRTMQISTSCLIARVKWSSSVTTAVSETSSHN